MKSLIIVLILLAFLQSSFLPINLILIILLSRQLIIPDKTTSYLAFGFGLLLSFLLSQPLGILSLIYLLLVWLISLIQKSPISTHLASVLLMIAGLVAMDLILESLVFKTQFKFSSWLVQIVIILPVFFCIRLWEERFIVKPERRLKLT